MWVVQPLGNFLLVNSKCTLQCVGINSCIPLFSLKWAQCSALSVARAGRTLQVWAGGRGWVWEHWAKPTRQWYLFDMVALAWQWLFCSSSDMEYELWSSCLHQHRDSHDTAMPQITCPTVCTPGMASCLSKIQTNVGLARPTVVNHSFPSDMWILSTLFFLGYSVQT
jgi:hypothetical protein